MTSGGGAAALVLVPGEGEPLPMIGTLRASASATGGAIEVIEYTGPAAPPPHVHREHDEIFIIMTGTFRFVVGNDVRDAPPGSVVLVPRGSRHGFTMEPGATAMLLVIPSGLEGYFRELGAGLTRGEAGAEVRAFLAGKYDSYPAPVAAAARGDFAS